MAEGDKEVLTYVNLLPTHAKNANLRPQLEKQIKEQLVKDVPAMLSRFAELEPLITLEVGEQTKFLMEAEWAFAYGLWCGVVALIGIAAEGFTDSLYNQFTQVRSFTGEEIPKEKLFGRDEYLPELRKLNVLLLLGLINKSSYDKLVRIRKLRDLYVHHQLEGRESEQDARGAMALFRTILKERFETKYTIRKGKIVERQANRPNARPSS